MFTFQLQAQLQAEIDRVTKLPTIGDTSIRLNAACHCGFLAKKIVTRMSGDEIMEVKDVMQELIQFHIDSLKKIL